MKNTQDQTGPRTRSFCSQADELVILLSIEMSHYFFYFLYSNINSGACHFKERQGLQADCWTHVHMSDISCELSHSPYVDVLSAWLSLSRLVFRLEVPLQIICHTNWSRSWMGSDPIHWSKISPSTGDKLVSSIVNRMTGSFFYSY